MSQTPCPRRPAPLPLTGADWGRAWRGLAAPLRAVRGGPAAVLVSVPLLLTSLLVWYLVLRVASYGLVWVVEGGDHSDAWGGPTLIGAWAVHALVGLVLVIPAMWLIRALTGVSARLVARRTG